MITAYSKISDVPGGYREQWSSMAENIEQAPEWLDVCEKLLDSVPYYFISSDSEKVNGVVISNLVPRLDCVRFTPDETAREMILLAREQDPDYFFYRVLFVGVPMSNSPGIVCGCEDYGEILDEVKSYAVDNLNIDAIFYTNISNGSAIEQGIQLAYPPNTKLRLEFDTFGDYLASLKSKKRWDLKNKRAVFFERGNTLSIVDNSDMTEYQEVYDLFLKTEQRNSSLPNYVFYNHEDRFASYSMLNDSYKWILAKKDNKLIGFALIVCHKDTLIFKHVGLDYEESEKSFTYFNLYYDAIDFAVKNKYRLMYCGSTTYDVKKRLGCELIDRSAFIQMINAGSDEAVIPGGIEKSLA